ncbi:hypothetical protein PR003_g12026 [Phytophthora rubi]|uniref:Uncharacterized protein n=1 Tax=Phytophthora rubi TaxID=129364 RepID=A0A6A3MRF6_9STRA|nr:hypothetical protein PR002_g8411 [Phytophthora rubi]KAE9337393.1 hypothetical protein PR003_g12026 [Phytophthora rubi]
MACLELILCGLYVHFVTEVTTSKILMSTYNKYLSVYYARTYFCTSSSCLYS